MNVYYMFAQNNTCCSLLLQCCYVFFFLAETWFSTLVAPTLLPPESSRFGWPCHPPQFWTDTPNLRPWIEDSPQRNSSKLSALLLIGFVVVVRDWAHILPCCYILTKCSVISYKHYLMWCFGIRFIYSMVWMLWPVYLLLLTVYSVVEKLKCLHCKIKYNTDGHIWTSMSKSSQY